MFFLADVVYGMLRVNNTDSIIGICTRDGQYGR